MPGSPGAVQPRAQVDTHATATTYTHVHPPTHLVSGLCRHRLLSQPSVEELNVGQPTAPSLLPSQPAQRAAGRGRGACVAKRAANTRHQTFATCSNAAAAAARALPSQKLQPSQAAPLQCHLQLAISRLHTCIRDHTHTPQSIVSNVVSVEGGGREGGSSNAKSHSTTTTHISHLQGVTGVGQRQMAASQHWRRSGVKCELQGRWGLLSRVWWLAAGGWPTGSASATLHLTLQPFCSFSSRPGSDFRLGTRAWRIHTPCLVRRVSSSAGQAQ